jgi:hypothetical protein
MSALRPLQPTTADLRKWRRLVKAVRPIAADPDRATGDLLKAAQTARRAVAPSRALLLACCSPLIRLSEAYGDLSRPCRPAAAARLGQLAEVLAEAVGEGGPADPKRPRAAAALAVPVERPSAAIQGRLPYAEEG